MKRNKYVIKETDHRHYPFAVTCGQTVITVHPSLHVAFDIKAVFLEGDKAHREATA